MTSFTPVRGLSITRDQCRPFEFFLNEIFPNFINYEDEIPIINDEYEYDPSFQPV